ncbi:MAG: response regulator [Rhodospirillaceae bacterium]|nr:response regulator [Rhodospirillaceae bacterium]
MDDLLSEFLTETGENMDQLDVELVHLEQNPNDPSLLGNIFRMVHTIKGTCGFLGLPRLESVAHAGENILGKFRDGEIEVTPVAVTLILACLDQIKSLLADLEATETEPEGEDSELIARLNAFADSGGAPAADAPAPDAEAAPVEDVAASDDSSGDEAGDAGDIGDSDEIQLEEPDEFGFVPVPASMTGMDIDAETDADSTPEPEPEPELESPPAVVAAPAAPAPVAKPEAEKADVAAAPKGAQASSGVTQTIRVNVDLLENLMTMVSELVLTRNQLLQILRNERESEFATPLQRLSHVTTELQEGVMKTRMQPIGNAWAKLPRIVRDLSVELNKKIDLQMIGAETELDRQVLELIRDPLTHMVRNSGDHGVEIPAERLAAGKPETGTISLNAFHEGGHIVIEISDDGKGLNSERIKEKVLSSGLATEDEIAKMSLQQIQQFIFNAGLSTAAAVTAVSGRGVGMDVVKTNIEKIGGTVELKSVEGEGTTFNIKIPLTLAIVSALVIECAEERFAIPQISVVELVLASANSEHKIEEIQGTPVLRLRNRLLPLISLRDTLKIDQLAPAMSGEETFIVVAQVGTYSFGIIVDRVFDTEEIVVKPVAPVLRHIPIFSGNTILGDGSVIMILDPNGIAMQTGDISLGEQSASLTAASADEEADDRVAMLLFRASDETPKAVPLALVARLEEIDLANVEWAGGRPMVQYRGRLMPLVSIDDNYEIKKEGRQPVVVFSDQERSMGLLVDAINDIVEDRLSIELASNRDGVLGTSIIAGEATDVIDTGYYLVQAFADWFDPDKGNIEGDHTQTRVLFVDDSPFFRNLLTPLLSVAGYSVTTVESAQLALNMCNDGVDFDLIVSDIEMPEMSGLEFARAVRTGSRWAEVPMIALSSNTSPKDLELGRDAGFTDYVAKFDRDSLLETLEHTLSMPQ